MAIEGGLSGWASEEDDLCEACCCRYGCTLLRGIVVYTIVVVVFE